MSQNHPSSPKTPAKARLLHTMIRVSHLDRSLNFYLNALGMRELRRETYAKGRFSLVFVGYGAESEHAVLELTYNWDGRDYRHGNRFGHLAIGVADVYAACQRLAAMGVPIPRQPGPMKHVTGNGARDIIAFIEDPDGYQIELIQITAPEPR